MSRQVSRGSRPEWRGIGNDDEVVTLVKEKSEGQIDRVVFGIPASNPDDEERLKEMIKKLQAA